MLRKVTEYAAKCMCVICSHGGKPAEDSKGNALCTESSRQQSAAEELRAGRPAHVHSGKEKAVA